MDGQAVPDMAALEAIKANYALTDEQRQIVDHVERVSREVLHPLQEKMDADEWWPDDLFRQMGELGLLGITAPEELGGSGQNEFTQALVSEVISKWNPAVGLSHGAHDNLCLNNILRNGSEQQLRKYVPGLCKGELVGALGLTEPGAGSDALGSMATTAARDGDNYIINGTKIYITNGPIADVILLYAKTDKAKGAKGISAFIVETDNPGFKVAQKLDKMGFRGSPTGELVFEDCRVPVSAMVGVENAGVPVVMSGLTLSAPWSPRSASAWPSGRWSWHWSTRRFANSSANPLAAFRWCNRCLRRSTPRSRPRARSAIGRWRPAWAYRRARAGAEKSTN